MKVVLLHPIVLHRLLVAQSKQTGRAMKIRVETVEEEEEASNRYQRYHV